MSAVVAPAPSRQWLALAGWLALCFATGAIGAAASADAPVFYLQLARPAWAPPGWVFGPVWSVLYAMMAVAAWRVWRDAPKGRARHVALVLFLLQLVANAAWSVLFFGLKQGGWAFAEVLVLWLSVAATLVAFRRLVPVAGALLVPYLAWVSFAAVLNWVVWRLNPGLLG